MRRFGHNPALWVCLALALVDGPAAGQTATHEATSAWSVEDLPRGEVIAELQSHTDPSQRYAAYLPERYDPAIPPPVFVVMKAGRDPLLPLGRAVAAAERLGWLVVSPHGTRSDGPIEPNRLALNAVLGDLQGPLPARMDRIVLGGFSGTARLAWAYGYQLAPNVVGVFGMGAGLPPGFELENIRQQLGTPFSFFGGAGVVDFNFGEMITLQDRVTEAGIPERLRTFPGPHAWPREDVFTEGLEWFAWQLVKRGDAPPYEGFAAEVAASHVELAEELLARGEIEEAHELAREISSAPGAAENVAERAAAVMKAAEDEGLETHRHLLRAHAAAGETYAGNVAVYLRRWAGAGGMPPLEERLEALEVDVLASARAGDDPAAARLAERMWGEAFGQVAFYEPARYLQAGDLVRARGVLEIAEAMSPGNARVCWFFARLEAREGRPDDAVERLRCALDGGYPWRAVEAESDFTPLREHPGFRELRGGEGGPLRN